MQRVRLVDQSSSFSPAWSRRRVSTRACRSGARRLGAAAARARARMPGRAAAGTQVEAARGARARALRAACAAACTRASPLGPGGARSRQAARSARRTGAAPPPRAAAGRIAQRGERHAGVAVRVRGAGGQAARRARRAAPRPHQADRQIHDERLLAARPRHDVGIAEQAQHQPVGRRWRDPPSQAASGFSSHTRPSGRGGRRSTGFVAAGNAGWKAGLLRRQRARARRGSPGISGSASQPSRCGAPSPCSTIAAESRERGLQAYDRPGAREIALPPATAAARGRRQRSPASP